MLEGNGGTGKSHVIKTISKWTEKILGGPGEIKPKVLLLAYSGVAASLIGNDNFDLEYVCFNFISKCNFFLRWNHSPLWSWIQLWSRATYI